MMGYAPNKMVMLDDITKCIFPVSLEMIYVKKKIRF